LQVITDSSEVDLTSSEGKPTLVNRPIETSSNSEDDDAKTLAFPKVVPEESVTREAHSPHLVQSDEEEDETEEKSLHDPTEYAVRIHGGDTSEKKRSSMFTPA
jgi:hypothetical protein